MSALLPFVRWSLEGGEIKGRFLVIPKRPFFERHQQALEKGYMLPKGSLFDQPVWNRLWMTSPLAEREIDALQGVFDDFLKEGWSRDDRVVKFANALKIAKSEQKSLEVELDPSGHADFGLVTIFPHCPKCKLRVSSSFLPPDSDEEMACTLCGTHFSPKSTFSQTSVLSQK